MRKASPLPSKEHLSERLNYDPVTGNLYWKHAPRSMFATVQQFTRFNSTLAGKVAGHKHKKKDGCPHAVVIRGIFGGEDRWMVAHRVIYALMAVEVPKGMEIDHKNRNPWDNRWENLRIATFSQNMFNRAGGKRKVKTESFLPKGVSPQKGRFKAQICINGKKRHIGMYTTPEEAGEAYRKVAEPHHGEFFFQPRSTGLS